MMMVRNDALRIFEREHREVTSLPLSADLQNQFLEWDEEYQDTFNQSDPLASCFASQQAEKDHALRGRNLAQRLQDELGDDYEVDYHPITPI